MYLFNTADSLTQINSISLTDNTFVQNKATIAAVFYSNLPSYFAPFTLTNVFQNNLASDFGSTQIVAPYKMLVFYGGFLLQTNQIIQIPYSGVFPVTTNIPAYF